jgi:cytochrome c-type biogenesis protein CcmH/NrfG
MEFLTALTINPGFYQAHYDLGLAYRMQGRFGEAAKEFQTVLRLKPDHRAARENLEILKDMIK